MKKFDVCIIGAGASGLMCCANIKNKTIALIDKKDKIGKKILATGNGKCNLTNINLDLSKYNNQVIKNYFKKFSFQGYKNTWNKSKNGNLSLKKSITDVKGYNYSNKKKYVSSTNAEKLIDSFFLKNKKCF